MDVLGFGSLAIILLTGTFTGGVLALNSATTLQRFGFTNQTGQLVATSLIRELGPVLTCLMLAGRVGSGIAAELGSMIVSEQIDAMRALGTDPIKKLVIPRIIALVLMAPVLTVICDLMGILGGMFVAISQIHQSSPVFLASAQKAMSFPEIFGGLIKPLVFGFVIAIIGCYMGLSIPVFQSWLSSIHCWMVWVNHCDVVDPSSDGTSSEPTDSMNTVTAPEAMPGLECGSTMRQ